MAQGMALFARALTAGGARRIAMEDPSSAPGREQLTSNGLEIVPTPVDEDGLLVDFLNELLLLHETEECAFASIRIVRLEDGSGSAEVGVVPVQGELEGVGVKAATYHQLRVERRPDGSALVEVYLDV
jgi:SHS2 domain-containing protein